MGGSGISWTICKSFAPRSRQITMPVPHNSVFTGWMLFLLPIQEHQSTEGTKKLQKEYSFVNARLMQVVVCMFADNLFKLFAYTILGTICTVVNYLFS